MLNAIRAHRGVDYAAPTGTPVRAAGDGRVQIRGRNGGFGNDRIEHGGGVHALWPPVALREGRWPGRKVDQGQVIGYVGSTGLATGRTCTSSTDRGGVYVIRRRSVAASEADPPICAPTS